MIQPGATKMLLVLLLGATGDRCNAHSGHNTRSRSARRFVREWVGGKL